MRYTDFYGLAGRPFAIAPDPAFHFPSDGHRRAVGCLSHGLRQGDGPILVTGEAGTGKTLLARVLEAQLGDRRVVTLPALPGRDGGDPLILKVAAAVGLDPAPVDAAAALAALADRPAGAGPERGGLLLVLDEAQRLAPAALDGVRRLAELGRPGRRPIRVLLLGRPELLDLLAAPELARLRERVVASHRLAPLGRDEIAAYVEHRLARVGWRGDPRLAADLGPALHALTGGVARRVNQVGTRLLVLGALDQRHELGAAQLDEAGEGLGREQGPAPRPAAAVQGRRALARLRRRLEVVGAELDRERRRREAAEAEAARLREALHRQELGRLQLEAEAARRLAELAGLVTGRSIGRARGGRLHG